MNILYLFSHCGNHFPPPPIEGCVLNHPTVVSSLIWAIVVIVLGLLAYCYLKKKAQIKKEIADADRKHESVLKEQAFKQEQYWHDEGKKAKEWDFEKEKFWYFEKELKKDYQKELNEKIQKLEDEKKKLSDNLDKEKRDRNEALKKERLQAEHDFYQKILKTFYKTDES